MKLGILTSTWGRPALTRQVLQYYARLRWKGVQTELVAVVSPEDPDPHEPVDGWRYLEEPNSPRGRKMNRGMAVMNALGVDAVMVTGSDDLISTGYLKIVLRQLELKRDVISVRDLYVYEPPSDRVMYCESMQPGVGRVFSRRALEHLRWRPWQGDIDVYLDASVNSRIRQVPIRRHTARDMGGRDFAVLDVKMPNGTQIWRLERVGNTDNHVLRRDDGAEHKVRKVIYLPANQFFRDYFPGIDYERLGSTA